MSEFKEWWEENYSHLHEGGNIHNIARHAWNTGIERFVFNATWTMNWDALYKLAEELKDEDTRVTTRETE